MENIFGHLGDSDDLFDDDSSSRKKKPSQFDMKEVIRSYKPKQSFPKKILEEANDNELELEELANLFKVKGDYFYFSKSYENALQSFQTSLGISTRSKSLNNTIFQRELNESMTRALLALNRIEEALDTVLKLEESSQNFEQYSSSLNVNLLIYEKLDDTHLDVYLTKICQLVNLHPLFINLWIRLGDVMFKKTESKSKIKNVEKDDKDMKYLIECFFIVEELAKHGYSFRSQVVQNQKQNQKNWLNEMQAKINKTLSSTGSLSTIDTFRDKYLKRSPPIEITLELCDKQEDIQKFHQSKLLTSYTAFKFWII